MIFCFLYREQLTFVAIAILMACSGVMQLSFISRRDWKTISRSSIQRVQRSFTNASNLVWSKKLSPQTDSSRDERSGKVKAD